MTDTDNTPQTGEVETRQQVAEAKAHAMMMQPITFGSGIGAVGIFASTDAFAQAQRMAVCLASATMIPDAYRQWQQKANGQWEENPSAVGNCMIALEMASRLNMPPLMIMQNMDVVKGRPGFRGAFVTALVNASPSFGRMRFEFSGEGKEYGCRAYATDKETGETLYGTKITWAMVTGEGWDKNAKWNTMRDQMFQYRAASFWSRVNSPELLLGMPSTEELEDVEIVSGRLRSGVGALNDRLGHTVEESTDGADASAPADTSSAEPASTDAKPAPRTRQRKAREPLPQNAAAPAASEPASTDAIQPISPSEAEHADDGAGSSEPLFNVE
ncbi:MAG: hypothetical protein V4641_05530 [Pseudomonadota bacterium]